jgi:glutamate decarboxylase
MIESDDQFELISKPELNILTYRFVPVEIRELLESGDAQTVEAINDEINKLIVHLQKRQRELGKAFVSRTQLTPRRYHGQPIIVFRVVLANPLTTDEILLGVLEEQKELAFGGQSKRTMASLFEIAGVARN